MSIHYKEQFFCKQCKAEFVPWKKQGTECPACDYLNKGLHYPFIDLFFDSLSNNLNREGAIKPTGWYCYNSMDTLLLNLFILFAQHYEQDKENKTSFEQKAKKFFNKSNLKDTIYKTKHFIELALAINKEFPARYKKILSEINVPQKKTLKERWQKWQRSFLP